MNRPQGTACRPLNAGESLERVMAYTAEEVRREMRAVSWKNDMQGSSRRVELMLEQLATMLESERAELTELRAIVARLREPVSDADVLAAMKASDDYLSNASNKHDWYNELIQILDADRKRILGEVG